MYSLAKALPDGLRGCGKGQAAQREPRFLDAVEQTWTLRGSRLLADLAEVTTWDGKALTPGMQIIG